MLAYLEAVFDFICLLFENEWERMWPGFIVKVWPDV